MRRLITSESDEHADVHERLRLALGPGFALEHELGGGGMSRVFVAEELALARRVVVKVLPPDLGAGVDVARFRREIALTARWQHPHIVPLLQAGDADGLLFYSMPFIDGESLADRIARAGALPLADAVRILRETADALAHAHAHGVVHRDIKPANILIAGRHAYVADFGVAKAIQTATQGRAAGDARGRLTTAGVAIGTPAYMPPEQAAADPATDHRADLYALGVVAYEALSGRLPFEATTPQGYMAAHIAQSPIPLAERRDDLPPALTALIDRLLLKDPDARPQSADEVLQELEALGLPSAGTTPLGVPRITAAPRRRRVIGAALLIAVGIATAGFLVLRSRAGMLDGFGGEATARPSREPVLVADFGAPGADPSLGVAASEATRTALSQSSAVTVVPASTVAGALGRMQRPSSARLDAALVREMALREGVRAFVDGSVTSVGTGYIVSLRLVSAESGDNLESFQEAAGDLRELLPTIDRLTRRLRERMGESLQAVRASPPLDRVTTASLLALRKYAAGVRAFAAGDLDSASTLLRHAIAIDTTFAMAYRALGATLINRSMPAAQVDSAAERAYRFRDRLPERERLLATAAYFQGTQWAPARDRATAAAAYAGVLALDPEDPDALLEYAFQLRLRRDFAGAERLYRRAAAIRATVGTYGALASAQLALGRVSMADSTIAEGARRFPGSGVDRWYRIVRSYERGAFDSVGAMLDSLRAAADANTRLGAIHTLPDYLLLRGRLAEFATHLAETRAAQEEHAPGAVATRHALLIAALDVWVRDRPARAVEQLDAALRDSPTRALPLLARAELSLQAAAAYARAGRADRAQSLLVRLEAELRDTTLRRSVEPMRRSALGELALSAGRTADALREFAAADRLPDGPSDDCTICLAANMGRAYERAGAPDSAIAAYERYLDTPDPYRLWLGTWWHLRDPVLRAQVHERLALLYRARGEVARASAHDAAFVRLWEHADPELQPRVAAARQRLAGAPRP